jgi:hypothetical protein
MALHHLGISVSDIAGRPNDGGREETSHAHACRACDVGTMLVLPTLAARPFRPPPHLAPPPPASFFSSWSCRTKRKFLQPEPLAASADAPRCRGAPLPLPEPEQRDQLLLAALHAARLRDEESRRPG